MTTGRFGPFGGQYIPETLMNEIQRLDKAYAFIKGSCIPGRIKGSPR